MFEKLYHTDLLDTSRENLDLSDPEAVFRYLKEWVSTADGGGHINQLTALLQHLASIPIDVVKDRQLSETLWNNLVRITERAVMPTEEHGTLHPAR